MSQNLTKTFIGIAAIACLGLAAYSSAGHAGPVREACKAEFEKFCKDVPDGGGRIRACFNEHAAEASDACREALGAHGPKSGAAAEGKPAEVKKEGEEKKTP